MGGYMVQMCAECILLSMVSNLALKHPPKWSRLEPGDRKRRGRPTEKRVQKLRGEIDARPFPDKADPRAPLRVRGKEWDDPQPGMADGEDRSLSSSKKTKVHNSISVYCLCIEPMPSPQESASQPTTGTKGGLDGPGEDADFTSSKAGLRWLSRQGRAKVHVLHSFGIGTVLHAVLHSVIFYSVNTSI